MLWFLEITLTTSSLSSQGVFTWEVQWVKGKFMCTLGIQCHRKGKNQGYHHHISIGRAYLTRLRRISCQQPLTVEGGFPTIPFADYITGCLSRNIELFQKCDA